MLTSPPNRIWIENQNSILVRKNIINSKYQLVKISRGGWLLCCEKQRKFSYGIKNWVYYCCFRYKLYIWLFEILASLIKYSIYIYISSTWNTDRSGGESLGGCPSNHRADLRGESGAVEFWNFWNSWKSSRFIINHVKTISRLLLKERSLILLRLENGAQEFLKRTRNLRRLLQHGLLRLRRLYRRRRRRNLMIMMMMSVKNLTIGLMRHW